MRDRGEMIGYCGYSCHLCAARSDDPETRQRLVDGWRKIFGHEHYTAANVKCAGCPTEGEVADKQCMARPCAKERGVRACPYCDDFPCDKVRKLLASGDGILIFCRDGVARSTLEEYELCVRQFESMPNVVRMLVDAGKLPAWAVERED